MKRIALCCSFGLIMLAGPLAQASHLQVEAGATYERLTDGYAPWRSVYAESAWKAEHGQTLYGSIRTTERFDLHDNEILAGAYLPLRDASTLLLEANASGTYDVLPRASGLVQWEQRWAVGIGTQLGLRRTVYDDAWTNQESLTVDRYFGSHYAAYTFYTGQIEGGGSPDSHRIQWRYYYTDASFLGVSYTQGVEIEHGASGTLTSDVRTLSLTGRHWITPQWALSYELLDHDQGTSYMRRGVRLGVRRQL